MDPRTIKLAAIFVFSGLAGISAYLPSPWSTLIQTCCAPVLLALGVSIKQGGGLKELLESFGKKSNGPPPNQLP